ncbi:hypothetical protein B566_EDAN004447 [Ephemera danica]|nr:hypothetical protein B566_EDAN004447 [Ephemera danica]
MMNFESLEAEAKATATKHVINMLQRPDQLEKVEQYKRRVGRKKASVESMLKTAMQSQLDGVRAGLNQLQTALRDVQDIKQNPELTFKALVLSMDQVNSYGKLYRDAIIEFKIHHFEDRSQVPYFTQYMITIVNNCLQFVELAQQTKQHYWRPGVQDSVAGQKFEALLHTFQSLRDEAAKFLLEEAFLDLEPHFQNLITVKWLTNSHPVDPVDTICITLADYFEDYSHLRIRNFEHVSTEAINLVAKKYITALLQKKITFKTYDDRKGAALKIIQEADKLKAFFVKKAPKVANFDSPFDALNMLAEVLKIEDPEILSLDLHGIVDKYPDITQEHLIQLLALRGDVPKSEIKETVSHILSTNKERQRSTAPKSIFSQVTGISTGFFST